MTATLKWETMRSADIGHRKIGAEEEETLTTRARFNFQEPSWKTLRCVVR